MQPVLVLQFMRNDGPGYLGSWAAREGVALEVRNAAQGSAFPRRIDGYRGLALLGGEMSVNDELPFLREAEQLILQAMQAQVPVIGHCLGGQLMAHALGAGVRASPAPEVGWHRMEVFDVPESHAWFGSAVPQQVFHWHFEAFELPLGAVRLGASAACPNQAFALGPHLAMQFHIEIDGDKIDDWLREADASYVEQQRMRPTVQGPERVHAGTRQWLAAHQALADRIYHRWLLGIG